MEPLRLRCFPMSNVYSHGPLIVQIIKLCPPKLPSILQHCFFDIGRVIVVHIFWRTMHPWFRNGIKVMVIAQILIAGLLIMQYWEAEVLEGVIDHTLQCHIAIVPLSPLL